MAIRHSLVRIPSTSEIRSGIHEGGGALDLSEHPRTLPTQADELERLVPGVATWNDWLQLSQASAQLTGTSQARVDGMLVAALEPLCQHVPADLGEDDLCALERHWQRMPAGDEKARLAHLLFSVVSLCVARRMDSCRQSGERGPRTALHHFLHAREPLGRQLDSVAQLIEHTKNQLDGPPAGRTLANARPTQTVPLHPDVIRHIAQGLLQRIASCSSQSEVDAALDDLLSFCTVCKPYLQATEDYLSQILALRLPFATAPARSKEMAKALANPAFDEYRSLNIGYHYWRNHVSPSIDDRALDATQRQWLTGTQQSVVKGYLKFSVMQSTRPGQYTELAFNFDSKDIIRTLTGITHPLGASLLPYALRLHGFPITRSAGPVNEAADNHHDAWNAIVDAITDDRHRGVTMGFILEAGIALRADRLFNGMDSWERTQPAIDYLNADVLVSFSTVRAVLEKTAHSLDLTLVMAGIDAIATILLAPHLNQKIQQQSIQLSLDFLVHYTQAGPHVIPASAQEALALTITQVGLTPEQAMQLRVCLDHSRRAGGA